MRLLSFLCLFCAPISSALHKQSKRNIITIAVAATNPNSPRSPIHRFNTRSPVSVHDFTYIPEQYQKNLQDLMPEVKDSETPPTKNRTIIDTKASFSHKAYLDKKSVDNKERSCCTLQ